MRITKKSQRIIQFVLFFVTVIMLISAFVLLDNRNVNAYADGRGDDLKQELKQNFDEDSILVVLDEEISKINKIHTPEFFNGGRD